MLFLKEFCVFSQTLQQQNRDQFFQVRSLTEHKSNKFLFFFKALATHGILNVIQVILVSSRKYFTEEKQTNLFSTFFFHSKNLDDLISKQAALDVFASIVECNPSTVREYMLQETQSIQDDEELLLNLVITEIRSDPDPGKPNSALRVKNRFPLSRFITVFDFRLMNKLHCHQTRIFSFLSLE